MRSTIGLCGLTLWLAGVVSAVLLESRHVREEDVTLTLSDGTSIHAVLYRTDRSPSRPQPAAVVLHGVALSHRSCQPGLVQSLVRTGFVVLAVDLRGHGHSGGSLPASWFDDLDHILELNTDPPEVAAALRYLQALPDVDPARVSLVGHSLGGLGAVSIACPRPDVASVVSISAAPLTCDVRSPRNLLLLAGGLDRFMALSRFDTSIHRATGDNCWPAGALFGRLELGTGREYCVCRGVSHLSALFDPSIVRRAVQWIGYSVEHDPGSVPGGRLMATGFAVLLAVVGGGIACTAFLRALADRLPPAGAATDRRRGAVWVPLLLGAASGPAATALGSWLPAGPMLFGSSTIVLCALLALVWLGAGIPTPTWTAIRSDAKLSDARGAWAGTKIGLLALVLGMAWLGLPLGATCLDLVPSARRLSLGLILVLLLFPWTLGLAKGLERALPCDRKRSLAARAVLWVAVPVVAWAGNELFNGRHPFFGVSVSLFALAFLLPLPLWLLPDRRGTALARAVCHAGSVAWVLACHLPFVHAG